MALTFLVLSRAFVGALTAFVSQFQAFVKEDTKYDNLEVNMGGRVLPVGLLHSARPLGCSPTRFDSAGQCALVCVYNEGCVPLQIDMISSLAIASPRAALFGESSRRRRHGLDECVRHVHAGRNVNVVTRSKC